MKDKVDNIYIYLWEEFNTVYIGRTKNLKVRNSQHKHRESERTYKFSSEHHVEHPNMIVLETDLTIAEGVEREKFWIDHYRNETNYNVLNIRKGGEVGNQHRIYTDEERIEHKKNYYIKNREKRIAYQKKYNSKNKEKIKDYQKEYFDKHKEEKKAYDKIYQKKWYEAHKKPKVLLP